MNNEASRRKSESVPTVKKKRYLLFNAGGILFIFLFLLLHEHSLKIEFSSRVPAVSFTGKISEFQKEQITAAYEKAVEEPSAKNIGYLGMIYHSNTIYDEASKCYSLASERERNSWKWDYYNGYLKREMGESQEALYLFKKVTRNNRKNSLAFYYMAGLFQNTGKTDSAEIYFRKAGILARKKKEAYDNDRTVYIPISTLTDFQLSKLIISEGRYKEADSILKNVLATEPQFGSAYRLRGNLHKLMGDSVSGENYSILASDHISNSVPVDTLADRLALISRSDQYLLKQIDAAIQSRNYNLALKLVRHAEKYISEDKYFIAKAIKVYLNMGFDNEAVKYLDRHLRLFADDFDQLQETAEILYDKGKKELASVYSRQLIKLKINRPAELNDLTRWLWKYNENNEVYKICEDLSKRYPTDPEIIYNYSYYLLSDKKTAEAEKYINRLRSTYDPKLYHLKVLNGLRAENENNMQDAISSYEEAFRLGKHDLQFVYYLGNLYLRSKNWEKALVFHENALFYYPNDPNLLGKTGYLLVMGPDQKIRNYSDGYEYSIRAFRHYATIPIMRISAGESASLAALKTGKINESAVLIDRTLEMAKKYNLPEEGINRLMDLRNRITLLLKQKKSINH